MTAKTRPPRERAGGESQDSSREPPLVHRPIMLPEVLSSLRPVSGDVAVDCTLGGAGHAQAIVEAIGPGGRLIGLDVDPIELPRARERLHLAGYGPDVVEVHHASFADLPAVLAAARVTSADVILVDLGTSAMQQDSAARGFSHKHPGPLDLRMDPTRGETGAALIARLGEQDLADVLTRNADEPHAMVVASIIKRQPITTTHALERLVRVGLHAAEPTLTRPEVRMTVRRTFQALRIAVNDEMTALDRLLDVLPACLAPGGRVAVLTFHSGEDRRVKQAFRDGHRRGWYASYARDVIRSGKAETFADRRAAAAKLRWAVRAPW
ncbi:MAG TPA: 16S rRNA (cytosine(1402)-N(4))-methyltransferase RsmH [Luteitalea sp.]|nr:16S rRNA (cytosine(1402)-N(4))-methyltransferase RsmH [Luteitalea sp.]